MLKKLAPLLFLSLAGCNSITLSDIVPSFWDDNQSAAITNVRSDIYYFDCDKPQLEQVKNLEKDINWFLLYSDSKGFTQGDVIKLVTPMHDTAVEWLNRATTKEPSRGYCKIKKEIMINQAAIAASAILGRY